MTNQPLDIVIGGIFALVTLVVGALLDFLKREPRYRYNVVSRADSYRMLYWFIGLTGWVWSRLFSPLQSWSARSRMLSLGVTAAC